MQLAHKEDDEHDSSFGRTAPVETDADAGPGAEEGGFEHWLGEPLLDGGVCDCVGQCGVTLSKLSTRKKDQPEASMGPGTEISFAKHTGIDRREPQTMRSACSRLPLGNRSIVEDG